MEYLIPAVIIAFCVGVMTGGEFVLWRMRQNWRR